MGWLAADIIPNSLYRVTFLSFVVSVWFLFFCFFSRWSFVDFTILIFSSADHVLIGNHVRYCACCSVITYRKNIDEEVASPGRG